MAVIKSTVATEDFLDNNKEIPYPLCWKFKNTMRGLFMMKKTVLLLILITILSVATVSAEHPDGFAVGGFGSFCFYRGIYGGGLSLVFPGLPVYWGISVAAGEYLKIGLIGDYYIVDRDFTPKFGWHFGLGGFFSYQGWEHDRFDAVANKKTYSYSNFDMGIRLPIALHLHPNRMMNMWLGLAPSFGIVINGKYNAYNATPEKRSYGGDVGFYWFLPLEVGIRFWF